MMILEITLLILASLLTFVKSSVQASILFLLVLLTLWVRLQASLLFAIPLILMFFLVATSLLIPRAHKRHLKRYFKVSKSLYLPLIIFFGLSIQEKLPVSLKDSAVLIPADLSELSLALSFFALVATFLITRKHAT